VMVNDDGRFLVHGSHSSQRSRLRPNVGRAQSPTRERPAMTRRAPGYATTRPRLVIKRFSPRSALAFCKDALPFTGARTNIDHSFAMGNREGIYRCTKSTRLRRPPIALM
jgi:hypothetical protein